jgi:hypothetical protein
MLKESTEDQDEWRPEADLGSLIESIELEMQESSESYRDGGVKCGV